MLGRPDPLANPETLIPRLYRYVAYMVGEGPDAEDLTSEAFERALRYRKSYDPRRGAALTWLIGIAAGCIRDRKMAAARRPTLVLQETGEQTAPGDLAEEAALRLSVRAVVERLSPRDRELVALRYGASLTAREIGEILKLRTNAVEAALHRLNARLRSELAGEGPADAAEEPRKDLGLVTDI